MFIVVNPFSGERAEFDNEAMANAKAGKIRAAILAQEYRRFTAVKEIVNGQDVTWVPIDLDSAVEESVYHVFNTLTGQHERAESLAAAKTRMGEIKQEFLNSLPIITFLSPEMRIALERERLKYENLRSISDAAPLNVTRLGE